MIEVIGLSKSYGSHKAVNNVSFNIKKGEIVGFLGPNGAGKSTIMNILTGYLSRTKGEVKIDGFDILESPEKAKKRFGYLPEIPPLYVDMSVREYLCFIYDLKKVKYPKMAHISEVMGLVGIDDVASRLIKNLSKGYRQRVGFAQALIGNPDVLILDEPTVGLDPKQIIEIRNLISRLGENHTIILSSHILSEIQSVCERIIIINKGNIVADDSLSNLTENLWKERSYVLEVASFSDKIIDALNEISGVSSIEVLPEEATSKIIIKPKDNSDIREQISKAVIENGGVILSFTTDKMILEQIFLSLTQEVVEEEEEEKDDSDI